MEVEGFTYACDSTRARQLPAELVLLPLFPTLLALVQCGLDGSGGMSAVGPLPAPGSWELCPHHHHCSQLPTLHLWSICHVQLVESCAGAGQLLAVPIPHPRERKSRGLREAAVAWAQLPGGGELSWNQVPTSCVHAAATSSCSHYPSECSRCRLQFPRPDAAPHQLESASMLLQLGSRGLEAAVQVQLSHRWLWWGHTERTPPPADYAPLKPSSLQLLKG